MATRRGQSRIIAIEKRRFREEMENRGHRKARQLRDDQRDYLAGLRSWGLRPHDLVKLNGVGPYVDYWHPEPGDAE